jgi:hypothetical protein
MPFRLNRHYRNNLFWIYPVIFAGLTFYAIVKDKSDRESDSRTNTIISIDSNLVSSAKPILPEMTVPSESIDTALVFVTRE